MYSSRFLRARKFNFNETKKMIKNCQHWRETVSGIGIDELNNRMDPFDVSSKRCEILVTFDRLWFKYPGREEVFKSWSMYFHKVRSSFHYKHFGLINISVTDRQGQRNIISMYAEAVPYIEQKGRPVNIQFFGGLNLPELYKHVTPEKLVESIIVNADALPREVLPAASRAAGHRVEQSLVIVDLKGFG